MAELAPLDQGHAAPRLARELPPFLARAGCRCPGTRRGSGAWSDTLQERAKTLVEMADKATFYLRRPEQYDPQATAKFWGPEASTRYGWLIRRLEAQADMDPAALEGLFRGLAADLGLKLVDLAQLVRIAVTGATVSPPIFQVVSILGREETLVRLRAAQAALESR